MHFGWIFIIAAISDWVHSIFGSPATWGEGQIERFMDDNPVVKFHAERANRNSF